MWHTLSALSEALHVKSILSRVTAYNHSAYMFSGASVYHRVQFLILVSSDIPFIPISVLVIFLSAKKRRGFRGPCSFLGQFWHPIPFHTFRSCHLPCQQKKGFVASHSGKTKRSFLSLHSLPPKKRGFRRPCSFFGQFWHPIPFHTFRSCHLPCHQKKGFKHFTQISWQPALYTYIYIYTHIYRTYVYYNTFCICVYKYLKI